MIGIGINITKRSGSYWTPSNLGAKVLFWGNVSEISGGQMPNKVTGSSDYLTIAAGNETYKTPNTAAYVSSDNENLWFRWIVGKGAQLNTELSSGANYSARNIIPSNTSPNNGTKVRVRFKATNGQAVISGVSIGVMTTDDVFDSAPTRITFDTGNNGCTITAGTTKLSDEITFDFDRTKRRGIHIFTSNRQYLTYSESGSCYFKADDATDKTMTLDPEMVGPAASFQMFDKLEVLGNMEVSASDLIGYDFKNTIIKYADSSPYAISSILILKSDAVLSELEENNLRDYFDLSVWWSGVLSSHGSLKQNRYIGKTYFGTDLISNGRFDLDEAWTKETGITISGGDAVFNVSSAGGLYQSVSLESGERYRMSFDIKEYTSGAVGYWIDYDGFQGAQRSEAGIFEEDFIYSAGAIPGRTELRVPIAFVGKCDNVQLRKISS